MWAMVVKEFRELRRDRRTVAMLVMLPLLFLVVFGYAANFSVDSIPAVVVGPGADGLAGQLPSRFRVDETDPAGDRADAIELLRDNRYDVAFVADSAAPSSVLVDGSALFTAQSAVAGAARAGAPFTPEVLFNPDLETSWVMVPALIGLIMAFIGTIVTSLGLVRERQSGTLEQLAVMPFRPSDVIVGKIAPYFGVAAVDMLMITVIGVFLFEVPFEGSVPLFAVGVAVFLFVVLGLGVLISTVSENQGQAIQAAMMVLLPQILLCGMIFPLEAMPVGVRWIGYLLPLTYFVQLAQGILLRGAGIDSLWPAYLVLSAMAVVVFGAAVTRFRRDLAPNVKSTKAVDG